MLIPARIEERLVAVGISQAELARRVSVRQSSINALVRGETRSSRHLHAIARELKTSTAYLLGETDDPAEGASPLPTRAAVAEQLDLVEIRSIDLAYGMGGTFTDVPIDEQVQHFPRQWIQSITHTAPAMLTWARGRGESMAPTIGPDDLILIDRSERTVREQDSIWAFTVGEIGMIKRLRVRGETVTILSDNPSVPPDAATVDEINIVGRIAFVGRRL
jgi:phage repressor protein C with HTH and peptisase S24 domain